MHGEGLRYSPPLLSGDRSRVACTEVAVECDRKKNEAKKRTAIKPLSNRTCLPLSGVVFSGSWPSCDGLALLYHSEVVALFFISLWGCKMVVCLAGCSSVSRRGGVCSRKTGRLVGNDATAAPGKNVHRGTAAGQLKICRRTHLTWQREEGGDTVVGRGTSCTSLPRSGRYTAAIPTGLILASLSSRH